MIVFWIVAAVIAAAASALMIRAAAQAGTEAEDPALGVYRRQLGELDDLAARGLIGEDEAKTARAETGRRLLRTAKSTPAAPDRRSSAGLITLAAAAVPLLALAAYMFGGGSPGAPDQPFAARLAAWRSADPRMLDASQMAAVLQALRRQRPNDTVLLRNIAIAEIAAGDPGEAARALRRAVAIAPGEAPLWVALGEALLLQNQMRPTPDSTAALNQALRLSPGLPEARYALARSRIGGGDLAGGLADWRALLASLPATDARRTGLEREIDMVARWRGLTPPPGQSVSPSINAAIRGMVDGLAARLRAQPDDPQGWTRLVRAYTVLGETARRDEALAQARARFRGRPDVINGLNEAARAPPQAPAPGAPR